MDAIRSILSNVTVTDKRTDEKSGAELINQLDDPGKLFFLERFPGVSQLDGELLPWDKVDDLPREYLDFLNVTNGANILGRYLKIAGLMYDPQKYHGCRLPDPVQFVNGHRPFLTPKNWLFFATYSQWETIGMAHVCIDCGAPGEKKPIICLPHNKNKVLKRWDSFEDWFTQEFDRLYRIYLEQKYKLVDIVPGQVQMIEIDG